MGTRPKINVTRHHSPGATRAIWRWDCTGHGCKTTPGGHGYRMDYDRAVEDALTHLNHRHPLTPKDTH